MKKKLLFPIGILLIAIGAVSIWLGLTDRTPSDLFSKKENTITLFATNDMHGRIDNFAKIKAIVDAERSANPDGVLLLSAGDKYTGNPLIDQYEPKGYPMVDLMNRAGYDFETFGNHEFDLGQQAMTDRRHQATFESLSANLFVSDDNTVVEQPRPYTIIRKNGVRIAILALTQASLHDNGQWMPSAHPQKLQGITFRNPIDVALEYKYLRKKCDLFVALTHIGYDVDIKLAEAMPELDVIVGGHSHTRIDSTFIVNGVLITQTHQWLNNLGKTTVTMKGRQVTGKQFELINLNKPLPEDAEVRALIDDYKANSPLNDSICEVTAQFNGGEAISTMMTDALLHELEGVDIALQNSGGVRLGQLPKGRITKADVFTINPFCNTVYLYDMTPADLRELFIRSYRNASRRADLFPAGIRYTIYTTDGKATRVEITDMDGQPLDENRTYRVAMNSYVATSYTFPGSDKGTELDVTDSDLLIDYLTHAGTIAPLPLRTAVVEE